jgi:hypothetical protein
MTNLPRSFAIVLLLALAGSPLQSQTAMHDRHASPHLTLSPDRPPSREDSLRLAAVRDTLRRVLVRYGDVHAAEADGFRPFAPRVKGQPVLHYYRPAWAVRARIGFDPARPPTLLYRPGPDGRLTLVGAMYTAPPSASWAELDRRMPLSLVRWHRHVNLCVPPVGRRERWAEQRDGAPVFGPESPIATREACTAVGGWFVPSIFGWMAHVEVGQGARS